MLRNLFASSTRRSDRKALYRMGRVRVALEALEQRVVPAVDIGDAPDPGAGTAAGNYQTLLSENGLR